MAGHKVFTRLFSLVFVFIAALAAPAPAHSAAAGLPGPVARALAQAGIPESGAAVYVQEIGAARPLVAYGADRPLNPASTMKLVTTYAALEILGPAYTWNTEVYTKGTLQQGTLNGDVYLKGYGDPKLTLEEFWLLLRNLRARGLRDIEGDLVLDHSYFSAGDYDPARFDDQPMRPYNTGPDALLVSFKAVTLQFVPDRETRTVKILVEPPLPQLTVVNHVKLSDGPCNDWVSRLKIDTKGDADSAQLAFSGSYAWDCGEKTRIFSVLGHRQYLAGLFSRLWHELGGTLAGSVRYGEVPPEAQLMTSFKSQPLAEIVRSINKFSNNVMARQVFLTLGAAELGEPATFDKSRQIIGQWLAGKGLSFPDLKMENGSGLSRVARVSARDLGRLLLSAYKSPVMSELMSSLPLVAMDGTMKRRLKNADVAGQAHIKGGTLDGVRAIAGYVLDREGRRTVVVFMVNHPHAARAQPAQDALLEWVYNHKGDDCCRRRN